MRQWLEPLSLNQLSKVWNRAIFGALEARIWSWFWVKTYPIFFNLSFIDLELEQAAAEMLEEGEMQQRFCSIIIVDLNCKEIHLKVHKQIQTLYALLGLTFHSLSSLLICCIGSFLIFLFCFSLLDSDVWARVRAKRVLVGACLYMLLYKLLLRACRPAT